MSNIYAGLSRNFLLKDIKNFAKIPLYVQDLNYDNFPGIWNLHNTSQFKKSSISNSGLRIVSQNLAVATGTSVNITIPQNVLANDIIIVATGAKNSTNGYMFNSTYKPSGFTFINNTESYDPDSVKGGMFYKIASGSESGTIINCPSLATGELWAGVLVVRGANTSQSIRSSSSIYEYSPRRLFCPANSLLISSVTLSKLITPLLFRGYYSSDTANNKLNSINATGILYAEYIQSFSKNTYAYTELETYNPNFYDFNSGVRSVLRSSISIVIVGA